ncbi:Protein ANTAGONIST OF LIKE HETEROCHROMATIN PROTEIN 1 [Frankliniella fusca]|uniref:Protein ANTAGONIST OF LIKE HETEROCHROMATIN PROTEIN 1 n=1 Tax=Frankliniella fusca TaxID=407009 RepID=A0AAE1HV44_9NEOP|nr:Protein ANTAGONIST OF LIKE HETEROCHROMATIN PROTEIN 1 [Frankliniella fusca]
MAEHLQLLRYLMEDDEDEEAVLMEILNEGRIGNDIPPRLNLQINIEGWRSLGDPTFRANFRMDRPTFEKLVVLVGEKIERDHDEAEVHFKTPVDVSIMIGLWVLFNADFFRSVGVKFGVSKGVAHFHYKRLVKTIASLADKFIVWPDRRERDNIQHAFYQRYGYPGTVGAIDGTHLYVTAPLQQHQRYVNRHHTYSILAQAVCDHNMLYRDVYVGEPGSVGDMRMFNRSPLKENLFMRPNMIRENEHLLGDAGFPLSEKILTPFPHNSRDDAERNHNRVFSSCRTTVERSFALLKNRFPRLQYFRSRNLQIAVWHIMSCFALHNFIILRGNPLANEDEIIQWDEGNQRVDEETLQRSRELGSIKREYIMNLLLQRAQ